MSDFVEVPTLSVRFTLHESLPHNDFEEDDDYYFEYNHQQRRRSRNHRDRDIALRGSFSSKPLLGDFPNAHYLTTDEIYETQWSFDTHVMQLKHYVPPHLGMLLVTETLLSTYALAASTSSNNQQLPSLVRSSTLSTTSSAKSSSHTSPSSRSSSVTSLGEKQGNTLPSINLISNGLINLGNTCYLNAQLQCAFHIPYVRSLILCPTSEQHKELSHKKPDNTNSEGGGTIIDDVEEVELDIEMEQENKAVAEKSLSPGFVALQSIFSEMVQTAATVTIGEKNNNEKDGDRQKDHGLKQQPPVSTALFCRSLGINPMEQQDAQEFWKLLLPHLECDPLTELYHGMYEDYITALDGSGKERRREESFLDLSLEISSGSVTNSLEKMFQEPELLSEEEGNGWRPEKGAPKVDALKGSLLRRKGLPSLLQFHLKRFCYDWQSDTMSKLNDPFSFPIELNLSKLISDNTTMDTSTAAPTSVSSSSVSSSSSSTGSIDEEDAEHISHYDDNSISSNKESPPSFHLQGKEVDDGCIYDLQSVVIHVGKFGSGHYYTYVRPCPTSATQKSACATWYRMDDSRVTPVSYRDVVEDAFGGKVSIGDVKESETAIFSTDFNSLSNFSTKQRRRSFPFFGLFGSRGRNGCNPRRVGSKSGSSGYGGKESCAYMLQYVKRSDIPLLYGGDAPTYSGKR